ncbi:MAG: Flp family type IVb pilin [Planctomycetota bacterium]|jgi:Flp pilus assembly pilin Flp
MKAVETMIGFCSEEKGLEMVEYAVIAALITVATLTTISALSTHLSAMYQSILVALGGS